MDKDKLLADLYQRLKEIANSEHWGEYDETIIADALLNIFKKHSYKPETE